MLTLNVDAVGGNVCRPILYSFTHCSTHAGTCMSFEEFAGQATPLLVAFVGYDAVWPLRIENLESYPRL